MDWRQYVREHLPPLEVSAERETEIVDELAIQLESVYERERGRGNSHEEAMARAISEVPSWTALASRIETVEPPRIHTPVPGMNSGGLMTGLAGDVRYALRTLRRTPAFSLVSVITLAAGLGMGAAAFSVIDTLLVRPLRFRSSEQLVLVHATVPPDARDTNEITYLDASDLARETQAFTSLGVVIPMRERPRHSIHPSASRDMNCRRRSSRRSARSPRSDARSPPPKGNRGHQPSSFLATGSGGGSARAATSSARRWCWTRFPIPWSA